MNQVLYVSVAAVLSAGQGKQHISNCGVKLLGRDDTWTMCPYAAFNLHAIRLM